MDKMVELLDICMTLFFILKADLFFVRGFSSPLDISGFFLLFFTQTQIVVYHSDIFPIQYIYKQVSYS